MPLGPYYISNNDRILKNLIKKTYIYTSTVERVMRSVNSNLKACKPCITSTVLESLAIRPGHKFLNIGSENGYINTLAGLLLGSTGVNHGIEVNKALVDIALEKLEDFKLNSAAIDHNVFCEPVFIHGNACKLTVTSFYDRVYCRPGVPPEHIEFMKSLIKIGGMLVMPLDNSLVRITRIDELRFDTIELFKVARTDLIVPEGSGVNKIEFPPIEPVSLTDLCRTAIRSLFHENIVKEFPDMDIFTKCKRVSVPEKNIFGLQHDSNEVTEILQSNFTEEQRFFFNISIHLVEPGVFIISYWSFLPNTDENIENYTVEDNDDLIKYQFQSDCKKNKLSLLLKDKINSLPLPGPLKIYLNYYRSD